MKINQVKIGVVLNYVNMMVGSLIPIFYTPIMLGLLGQNEYGIYKLASSVTSYLGLISLGLGSAVSRYLIKARVEGGTKAEEKILGLFLIVFRVIALVTLFIGAVLALNLGKWYGASLGEIELKRMQKIVGILVCNTSISFALSPYISVVSSRDKHVFIQSMNIVTTCVGPVVNLIMLYLGFASIGLAFSSLLLNVVVNLLYYLYITFVLEIRASHRDIPVHLLKEILLFSFWVFLANIVSQLYNSTDTMLIGMIPGLGAKSVAVYNVGTTFSGMVLTLTIGISSILSPKTNKMVFSGASNHELTELAIRVGRIQGFIVALVVSGFAVFGRSFINLYVGSEYKDSYWVALLLMINGIVPLVQSVCLNIIVAQNKHKFRSVVYLGIAIVNVFGTWYVLQTPLGIVGAALVTLIAGVIGGWFIMNWYYAHVIKLEMKWFWKSVIQVYYIPAVILLIASMARLVYNTWPSIFVAIMVYSLIYFALEWFLVFNEYEKSLICNAFIIFKNLKRK